MTVESPERRPRLRVPWTARVPRPVVSREIPVVPHRLAPAERARRLVGGIARRLPRGVPGPRDGAPRTSSSMPLGAFLPVPLRSTVAAGLAEEDVLYRDERVTVMPSWLEIDGRESYAVRSIVRLSLAERAPPRAMAGAVCAVALVLAVLSGVHLVGGSLPLGIAWALLAASLALALVASHVAFVRPSEHVLDVRLADGTPVRLVRPERHSLLALHGALSRAMERQRGGS